MIPSRIKGLGGSISRVDVVEQWWIPRWHENNEISKVPFQSGPWWHIALAGSFRAVWERHWLERSTYIYIYMSTWANCLGPCGDSTWSTHLAMKSRQPGVNSYTARGCKPLRNMIYFYGGKRSRCTSYTSMLFFFRGMPVKTFFSPHDFFAAQNTCHPC